MALHTLAEMHLTHSPLITGNIFIPDSVTSIGTEEHSANLDRINGSITLSNNIESIGAF